MKVESNNYPCKDCGCRQVGCHSKCDKYIAAKKKAEVLKQKVAEEAMMIEVSVSRSVRIKKRR